LFTTKGKVRKVIAPGPKNIRKNCINYISFSIVRNIKNKGTKNVEWQRKTKIRRFWPL
jgi:hypothetical protein